MKKLLLYLLVIFAAVSCKKEIFVVNPVHNFTVKTDSPPSDLFASNNIPYGQVRSCLLNRETFDFAINQGYNCNQQYNSQNGQWTAYDCGYWHLVSATPYWGQIIKNGDTTTYVGTGVLWCAISESNWSIAGDLIRSNGQALADINWWGNTYQLNPFGINYTLQNVRVK
ncbi:MAG: hypothetical protein KGI58_01270 [Patescibacteria group bacterium]|nr:hypothetical protein [Patescibacteria group bacterium]